MGAMGAVGGATGAVGGATAEAAGKLPPPRMEGCSTGMGRVEDGTFPAIMELDMELDMDAPRPNELISGDCCEQRKPLLTSWIPIY